MNESYLTVSNTACDEIVIQKSRFIGYAAPCNTEEEAQAALIPGAASRNSAQAFRVEQ